ncbi:MAG: TonB-dependent siderophore receptor [Cyanobacteria bacterium P01_D01_bin.156]
MKSFVEYVSCRYSSFAIAPILIFQLTALLSAPQASYAQAATSEPVDESISPPEAPPLPEPPLPELEQIAQITDVVLTELEDGLLVVLVTSDPALVEVFQFQEQNTLVIDIAKAELALPDGDTYKKLSPVPTVESLTLEQRGNEVQMTIVGTGETAPNAYLERAEDALRLDIVTTALGTTDNDLDFEGTGNLRIIVAAEPLPSYRVPTASAGTRTDTDPLDVPQGIQVIPDAVVEDQASRSLSDTLRNASGVNAGRASTGLRATTAIIRGFESDNVLRNGLRDDTLRISSGLNNIERIEILKGPASVLFGAGNLGGTINLVTEVPLDEPRYEFELSTDSNELYGGSLDLTGPLNEEGTLGYRLNMAYEDRGSFKDFENSQFFFFAPTFELANTDRSSLLVDIEYLETLTDGDAPGVPAVSAIGADDNDLPQLIALSPEDDPLVGTLDLDSNLGEPDITSSETTISRLGVRLRHELSDDWTVRGEFLGAFQDTPESSSIVATGFSQVAGQPDFGLLDRVYIENISRRDIYTFNTNIVGNIDVGGFDQTLLLGAEFSHENAIDIINQRLFFNFLSPESETFRIFDPNYDSQRFFPSETGFISPERPGSNSVTETTTLGLYGQAQLNLADKLLLLAGGRFDIADQFFQDFLNRGDTSAIDTYDTAFSPRFGAVLKPAENVSLYASYTESFNPTLGRDVDGDVFIPEEGKQFETGIKANLLNDRLSIGLAYYQLRRSNVVTQDPTPGNDGFQIQVGEQASDGVELDIVGEILPGWNIIANYAYTDARITEDNEFGEGVRLLNVPEHSANLWTSYEIQSGELAGLGAGIGVYFQGDRNGDLRIPFTLPGYTVVDASLFYRRENFRAQLNFENLFDIRYFESARDQFRVNPGAPFSVEASLNWEF